MHDGTLHVPISRIIACTVWSLTGALLAFVFIAYWAWGMDHAHLFGYAACVSSAVAAVAHVRCYALRAVRMVLAATGHEESTVRQLRR